MSCGLVFSFARGANAPPKLTTPISDDGIVAKMGRPVAPNSGVWIQMGILNSKDPFDAFGISHGYLNVVFLAEG